MNTKLRREAKEMEFKSYDIEKRMLEGRKIIVSKESKFKTAKRIISRYSKEHINLQFNTFFKMYMLQAYKVEKNLYRGSGLELLSIRSYMSTIKAATGGIPVTGKYQSGTTDTIFDFIQDIKSVISPIPYYSEFETDNRSYASAYSLLDSDYISQLEKDFIVEDLYEVKAITKSVRNKNKVIQKPVEDSFTYISKVEQDKQSEVKKEKEMKATQKRKKSSITEAKALYRVILSNWGRQTCDIEEQERLQKIIKKSLNREVPVKQIYGILNKTQRHMKGANVVGMSKTLQGIITDYITNNELEKKVSKTTKQLKTRFYTTSRDESKGRTNLTEEQAKIASKIIVQHYSCGSNYIVEQIKNTIGTCYSDSTVKRYQGYVKALAGGKEPSSINKLSQILYQAYLESKNTSTDSNQPTVSELLSDQKPIISETESLEDKFILVQDNKILCTHTNKCFIEGFLECGGQEYKNNSKVYKVSEVVM